MSKLEQMFGAHFTIRLLCYQCKKSFILVHNNLVLVLLMLMAEALQLFLCLLVIFLKRSREVWYHNFSNNDCG